MTTIWFIDDNELFLEAMKKCLKIDANKNYGVFENKISVNFFDPGIDGLNIIEIINNARRDFSTPDVIFLDLRYPVDKRSGETNPMKLSGIKILDAMKQNSLFDSSYPVIFSEVALNEHHINEIKEKYNYSARNVKFIEKNPLLHEIQLKINGIDSYIATKNCDSMKEIMRKFIT